MYAKSISVSGSETNGEVPLLHYGPRTERVNLTLLDSASKDIYLELLPKYVNAATLSNRIGYDAYDSSR